jgi:hypothetical protein
MQIRLTMKLYILKFDLSYYFYFVYLDPELGLQEDRKSFLSVFSYLN